MVARRGSGTMGCLIPLVIAVLLIYFGRDFATAYFHYYQFRDGMKQEARFATGTPASDDTITAHLHALADSLDLPGAAHQIRIAHEPGITHIWADYDQTVQLPFKHEKELHFHATSEGAF